MKIHNDNRARRCDEVLRVYGTDFTRRGCLVNFLTDARHWCDRNDGDFAELDRMAYEHYAADRAEAGRRQP